MNKAAGAALAAAVAILATGAVIAQSDPISARKGLMKENENNAVTVVRMMRGQLPYDPAKVDAAFAQWADTAKQLPSLFPDNSKTGQNTRAAPKIWTSKADFDAKAAAFGKAVAENREKAKGSVEGLRAAIPAVGNACDACHKDYRLAKQ
ncbi:MAG TPA: cytochrome c [Pseudolabrys sp.]|nr:cytochrome c [Pseudolabrys sp.]